MFNDRSLQFYLEVTLLGYFATNNIAEEFLQVATKHHNQYNAASKSRVSILLLIGCVLHQQDYLSIYRYKSSCCWILSNALLSTTKSLPLEYLHGRLDRNHLHRWTYACAIDKSSHLSGPCSFSINIQRHSANSFTTVMIKWNWLPSFVLRSSLNTSSIEMTYQAQFHRFDNRPLLLYLAFFWRHIF
jgi:hypothetical protein